MLRGTPRVAVWRALSLRRACGAVTSRAESPTGSADLAELLGRARSGDRSAFDAMVRACYPGCWSYASLLLRDSRRVEEVLLDVFVDLHYALPAIRSERQLHVCVLGAIAHRCRAAGRDDAPPARH